MELIGDLLPAGVLNVVNGFGVEAGKPLASSPRIAKIAFTGETTTGRLITQYAAENIIPLTLELGGKSLNVFFADTLARQYDFAQKCFEGFNMFALNQGEVCTCPSRALIEASIYDEFLHYSLERARTTSTPPTPPSAATSRAGSGNAEAAAWVERLRGQHGPLMFHQSGGCCGGSSPMCYPLGEFRAGSRDVFLGTVTGCPFYMSGPQFEYWRHTHLTVDVVPGRGSGFSVEAPEGVRFLIRSRLFTESESLALAAEGDPPTGPIPD